MNELVHGAISDIAAGLRARAVWMALASEDIGDAHKRTTLGPLWLLVNYLVFTSVLVFIIRGAVGIEHYFAYVAVGLLVWLFISETISESVTVFSRQESFIKGTVLPLSVYIFRQCTRTAIRSAYAMIGAAGIVLYSGAAPNWTWLTCIPAIILIFAVAPAVTIIFGVLGVLFRDIRYFLGTLMRLGMFVTPIFWSHENQGGLRAALYYWNPFTYFIDIVRMPLITGEASGFAWLVCLEIGGILWVSAILILGQFRKKIVFLL